MKQKVYGKESIAKGVATRMWKVRYRGYNGCGRCPSMPQVVKTDKGWTVKE